MNSESSEIIKKMEKENFLLKRKLENSESQREQLEHLMEQHIVLLKRVSDERLTEEDRRKFEIFQKFVPREFLISLGKEHFEEIQLGDYVEREMTILFSDIRNFVRRTEFMAPKETFNFINEYLQQVEPVIHIYNGFVDKFIGDAIMALFYSPDEAVKAGIEMRQVINKYNEELREKKHEPIEFGLGIHTGECMLGIIGGEYRMEGTVISDAVNFAARLESLTKRYDSSLLISELSYSKMTNKDHYKTRFLGKVQVAGKTKIVRVLEILDAEKDGIRDKKWNSKKYLEEGLEFFFKQRFREARESFISALKEFPDDAVANLYLFKCSFYITEGVPENWEGIDIIKKIE